MCSALQECPEDNSEESSVLHLIQGDNCRFLKSNCGVRECLFSQCSQISRCKYVGEKFIQKLLEFSYNAISPRYFRKIILRMIRVLILSRETIVSSTDRVSHVERRHLFSLTQSNDHLEDYLIPIVFDPSKTARI